MYKSKPLNVPYFEPWITNDDKKFVLQSLNQRWLTNGPFLKKFENNIKKFTKTKFSIGVSSATHALHLALKSIGVGPNDEVILPTMTFSATAESVIYCGGKPVFTDVDLDTFNILPQDVEKNISKSTKAIIVVHYGGQSCDMKELMEISKKNNLPIIEDCAHSLGSKYKNQYCGSIGIAGCFSFYPTKIIQTGEGGMITTNNKKIFEKTKLLRSHGMNKTPDEREKKSEWKYDITELGFNYRLDEIRSSLGFSQSKRIDKINNMRIKIAKKYDKKLRQIPGIQIPILKPHRNHIYHLYSIQITKDYSLTRDELFQKLVKKNIGASVQYRPLHLMSFYKNISNMENFPNANILSDNILSLPIFPLMSEKQINYVVNTIKLYS